MNKILILAILIGTSITSGFSQSVTEKGDIIIGRDTIGKILSKEKDEYSVIVTIRLYKNVTKKEKQKIHEILGIEYKESDYGFKIYYERDYKNPGEYLIESGDLQNKSIRIRIMGIISGSFLSAIGMVTLNPGLVYLGGTVMTASGVLSLIIEVKGNNSLINSGKKMRGKNR